MRARRTAGRSLSVFRIPRRESDTQLWRVAVLPADGEIDPVGRQRSPRAVDAHAGTTARSVSGASRPTHSSARFPAGPCARLSALLLPPAIAIIAAAVPAAVAADASLQGDEIPISRASGPIEIDANLGDPGWSGAARVETWYETNPGDNLPPKVKSVGWLAYDDRFLYAAFEFSDPDPSRILAPLGDHDRVPGYTDYGGIILDTRNDGKTGLLLLTNPRGVQYDAVTDDVTGIEDSSPDFYWDSAARITETGWILEMRVPFSSLRYASGDPQTWGILLYRNYPREFHYQFFSAKLPRGSNCFICRSNRMTGLAGLPSGSHAVLAPFATASETGEPRGGELGRPLVDRPAEGSIGLDAKWTPNADTCIDGAFKPDFSQVESDVAQISANERFALFFPEKRPFFLEDVELFSTPVQAVYTRTITSPRWGLRATGKIGATAYTALVAADQGGGSVILPGPDSSSFADQEFASNVFVGRLRHDFGISFASFLATDREVRGGGSNRVFGPDFLWRLGEKDALAGQYLLSRTVDPDRPDLSPEWTGERSSSHAADLSWSHSTRTLDWFLEYKDYGDAFRADVGFVPQVGFREASFDGGYTFRPSGPIPRLRTFLDLDRTVDRGGGIITDMIAPGFGMDGPLSSFARFRFIFDRVRSGETLFPRRRFTWDVRISPSRIVSLIEILGEVGREVDFANSRSGHGGDVTLQATLSPSVHLEVDFIGDRRWLNVEPGAGPQNRLFTADLARLRAVYTFTSRMFLRIVAQDFTTVFDPALYTVEVPARTRSTAASALFAYKLNWQSVLFVGYGDDRALDEQGALARADRQVFLKLSYALQR